MPPLPQFFGQHPKTYGRRERSQLRGETVIAACSCSPLTSKPSKLIIYITRIIAIAFVHQPHLSSPYLSLSEVVESCWIPGATIVVPTTKNDGINQQTYHTNPSPQNNTISTTTHCVLLLYDHCAHTVVKSTQWRGRSARSHT